jgi:GT2 family glycosyltransferase
VRSDSARRFLRRYLGFLLGSTLRSCLDPYAANNSPQEVDAISGACLLLRRDAITEVGLLDEHFFMYVEDLDYCMRFRQAGWKLYYLPTIQIIHLAEKSSAGRMRRYSIHPYQSLFYFYRKHYSTRTLLVARLLVFIAFCARWTWNLVPGSFLTRSVCRQNRSDIAKVIRLCCGRSIAEQ